MIKGFAIASLLLAFGIITLESIVGPVLYEEYHTPTRTYHKQ